MSTRILMIRHGYSVANADNLFAGHWDAELTDIGKQQAQLAARYFDTHTADAIYASDLQRAYETALPAAAKLGLPVIKDPDLREVFAGEWEGMNYWDIGAKDPKEFDAWLHDIGNAGCVGGETTAQLAQRITGAVKRIAEAHDGQTVCIATHATPIRVMCTVAQGLPLSEMASVPWVSNASVSEFEYRDGTFSVIEINHTSHLGDLETSLPDNV